MHTSRRDIFLLACCQALLLVNSAGLISMNGLIGFSLAHTKALATFGATTYVLGSALAAMPMSMWMGRVGRRAGFMTGALVTGSGWETMNRAALPVLALIALAALWLSWQRRRGAAAPA
ncbi:MAG TPA: hypothetical protein VKT00_07150 [Casimicrobiaceae bacterium]|nr:hypothetical protein [Casimicrobiaceae bacterium]